MTDGAVFVLGLGLIIISGVTSGQLNDIWQLVWNGKTSGSKNQFVLLGGELLFIAILAFLARSNKTAGQMIFSFLIALYVVWSVENVSTLQKWADTLTQGADKNA